VKMKYLVAEEVLPSHPQVVNPEGGAALRGQQ